MDLDGQSLPNICNLLGGEYYVAIRHRNHLGIMTPQPLLIGTNNTIFDFTQNQAYNNGQKRHANGYYTLIAGDATGDGSIDAADRSSSWNNRNTTGLKLTDVNLNGQVEAADRSIIWNNRNSAEQLP